MPLSLKSKHQFYFTSPRSPEKTIPEIKLLIEQFSGHKWNRETQENFAKSLREQDFFEGSADFGGLSARDRITRAPKALGFVDLNPVISITPAGQYLIDTDFKDEAFLRQELKFQLPSPFHGFSKDAAHFWIKPYLEIIRLIYTLEYLTFDELKLFGLMLTDYHDFEKTVEEIKQFRQEKKKRRGQYKKFISEQTEIQIRKAFKSELLDHKYKLRENDKQDEKTFIKTKSSNARDYADACVRYIRITGLITISSGEPYTIRINTPRLKEVEYILKTVSRDPVFVDDKDNYKKYLYDPTTPTLYTDNRFGLIDFIVEHGGVSKEVARSYSLDELKSEKNEIILFARQKIVDDRVKQLKTYSEFEDICNVFENIDKEYDPPLMLEWNTWRAMTMLGDGNIKGNFNIDMSGQPVSTAGGNKPDIECYYDDFDLLVEVTMLQGMRQYEAEGEPVMRHLGKYKMSCAKQTYCLFIAPSINQSTITYFYMLHKTNLKQYGGEAVIIPISIDDYSIMLKNAKSNLHHPTSKDLQALFVKSHIIAKESSDEEEWYKKTIELAHKWATS